MRSRNFGSASRPSESELRNIATTRRKEWGDALNTSYPQPATRNPSTRNKYSITKNWLSSPNYSISAKTYADEQLISGVRGMCRHLREGHPTLSYCRSGRSAGSDLCHSWGENPGPFVSQMLDRHRAMASGRHHQRSEYRCQ